MGKIRRKGHIVSFVQALLMGLVSNQHLSVCPFLASNQPGICVMMSEVTNRFLSCASV